MASNDKTASTGQFEPPSVQDQLDEKRLKESLRLIEVWRLIHGPDPSPEMQSAREHLTVLTIASLASTLKDAKVGKAVRQALGVSY